MAVSDDSGLSSYAQVSLLLAVSKRQLIYIPWQHILNYVKQLRYEHYTKYNVCSKSA
jgi:hypothetical protein